MSSEDSNITGKSSATFKATESSKWNSRYANSTAAMPTPAAVLTTGKQWLPAAGRALDLACGRGANALWLAARGFDVTAWDSAERAIRDLKSQSSAYKILAEVRDVVASPPVANSFEVIVVSRFLDRKICADIAAALTPGGLLFYQTFTQGLSNPNYMLANNELTRLFSMLDTVWFYQPDEVAANTRAEAMLIARRPLVDGPPVVGSLV